MYYKNGQGNRHPDYLSKLRDLTRLVSEGSDDFQRLSLLLQASLKAQYKQERSPRTFDDAELERQYRLLRCCKHEDFYRFKEPAALTTVNKSLREERRKSQHTQSKILKGTTDALDAARRLLAAVEIGPDYHDEETAKELFAAIQQVTGRRNVEICLETTVFEPEVPGQPYMVKVTGLAKKRHLPCDLTGVESHIVPCTAPARQVTKELGIVRRELCNDGTRVVKRRKIDEGQEELFGKDTRFLCREIREVMPLQAYEMRTRISAGLRECSVRLPS
jgi:hypothetical protein